jgi:hypothetical protein
VQFDILLPTADTHTIYLWVAAEQLTGRLTASMAGATDFVDSSLVANSSLPNWNSGVYQLTVTPDSAGQTINLEYFGIDQTGSGSRFAVIAGVAVSVNGVAVNTFADWIGGYSGLGGLDALDDDPDGDGIDNGVENFFGTEPGVFSQGLVSGTVDTGTNTFTFTHPLNPTPAVDLTATYRWSTDLLAFYNDGAANGAGNTTVTFSDPTPAGDLFSVTATITGSVIPDRLFVDVKVTQD